MSVRSNSLTLILYVMWLICIEKNCFVILKYSEQQISCDTELYLLYIMAESTDASGWIIAGLLLNCLWVVDESIKGWGQINMVELVFFPISLLYIAPGVCVPVTHACAWLQLLLLKDFFCWMSAEGEPDNDHVCALVEVLVEEAVKNRELTDIAVEILTSYTSK